MAIDEREELTVDAVRIVIGMVLCIDADVQRPIVGPDAEHTARRPWDVGARQAESFDISPRSAGSPPEITCSRVEHSLDATAFGVTFIFGR